MWLLVFYLRSESIPYCFTFCKKTPKTITLLHFTFSCFVKGNAVAQVTGRLSSSQDQVESLLELNYPRCAFNLKMTL